jgi:hypothetical protein
MCSACFSTACRANLSLPYGSAKVLCLDKGGDRRPEGASPVFLSREAELALSGAEGGTLRQRFFAALRMTDGLCALVGARHAVPLQNEGIAAASHGGVITARSARSSFPLSEARDALRGWQRRATAGCRPVCHPERSERPVSEILRRLAPQNDRWGVCLGRGTACRAPTGRWQRRGM